MARQNNDRPHTLRSRLTDLAYPVNRALLPYQCVDAGVLKIIAIVTMFIDHLTFAFLELPAPGRSRLMDTLPNGVLLGSLGRMIGRTALPIFAFLVVEGYVHTRSRMRYLLRLLVFAFLSEYQFRALFYPYDTAMHCDTLFTLALGLVAIWAVDSVFMRYIGLESRRGEDAGEDGLILPMRDDPIAVRVLQIVVRFAIAVAVTTLCCLVATEIGADYRYGGVLLMMIFYLLRGLRIAGVALGYTWISWYNINEIYSFAGMALIQLYNGQRGRQLKYLFYLFYPGHLLLLLVLRMVTLGF